MTMTELAERLKAKGINVALVKLDKSVRAELRGTTTKEN